MTEAVMHEYRSTPVPYIYLKWEFMIDDNFFREGMEKLIVMMDEHKTGRILANVTQLGPLSDEDQEWTVYDWLPRAIAVGYYCVANVIAEDIFGKMAIEDIMNNDATKMAAKTHYFDDDEKAIEWLASI